MRVTGGESRGARLRTLKGTETRPTADQVRKAIFDIAGPQVEGSRFLDLFAGSGAVGIEALSRGAVEALFVESSREACGIILENLNATGHRARGIVKRGVVERFLTRPPEQPFDLGFLDPPYASGLGFVARMLGKLGSDDRTRGRGGRWIRAGGTVIVESAPGRIEWPDSFRQTRVRTFGRTQIAFAVLDDDA
jgi:16S rRNA (guanine(966)-N(2))-methyltransferase RsmD